MSSAQRVAFPVFHLLGGSVTQKQAGSVTHAETGRFSDTETGRFGDTETGWFTQKQAGSVTHKQHPLDSGIICLYIFEYIYIYIYLFIYLCTSFMNYELCRLCPVKMWATLRQSTDNKIHQKGKRMGSV